MKTIKTFLGICVALLPLSATAMTVSDPTSYTYYVEQLKEAKKQIEQMQQVNGQLQDLYARISDGDIHSVDRVRQMLEGAYQQGLGASDEIQGLAERLGIGDGPLERSDKDGIEWAGEEFLRENFRTPGTVGDSWHQERRRQAAREYTYEQALEAYHRSSEGLAERLELQAELADRIDQTENVKEAQDLTNRILVELLSLQTEMLSSLNYMGAVVAIKDYRGYTEAEGNSDGQGSGLGGNGSGGSGFSGEQSRLDAAARSAGGHENWEFTDLGGGSWK